MLEIMRGMKPVMNGTAKVVNKECKKNFRALFLELGQLFPELTIYVETEMFIFIQHKSHTHPEICMSIPHPVSWKLP